MRYLIGCIIFVVLLSSCGSKHVESGIGIKKWPDNIVYYNMDVSLKTDTKVREVMDDIQSKTNVTFIESSDDKYTLYIIEFENGYSEATLGYMEYPYMHLQLNVPKWLIYHEIFHVLGMLHEHQREDRDIYIDVLWNNIDPFFHFAFNIDTRNLYNIDDYPYDFKSIMHYNSRTLASSEYSILKIDGSRIYQVHWPSVMDWKKINFIYK